MLLVLFSSQIIQRTIEIGIGRIKQNLMLEKYCKETDSLYYLKLETGTKVWNIENLGIL